MLRKHLLSLVAVGVFTLLALGSTDGGSSVTTTTPSYTPSTNSSDVDGALAGRANETPEQRIARIRERKVGDCTPPLKWVRNRINKNPEWPDHIIAHSTCNSVIIGMTKEQAIAAWGRPQDINRTLGSFGVHEQWVYGEYGERGYLYFEDGILTTVQN